MPSVNIRNRNFICLCLLNHPINGVTRKYLHELKPRQAMTTSMSEQQVANRLKIWHVCFKHKIKASDWSTATVLMLRRRIQGGASGSLHVSAC